MREAFACSDRDLLRKLIHTLKGFLGAIGAYELEEEVLLLEKLIEEGHVQSRDVDMFATEFSLLIDSLKEYVEEGMVERESLSLQEKEVAKKSSKSP